MMDLQMFKLAVDHCGTKTGFLPGIYDGLCGGITSADQIWKLVANIVRILMSLGGALAVVFIIVGGIFYITSIGDPARIKRAKEIITQAVVGLVVIGVAYTVVTYIANKYTTG